MTYSTASEVLDKDIRAERVHDLSAEPSRTRNSSGDSTDGGKDIKGQLRELNDKYKKSMMTNAQLDNEKQALIYQVNLLQDKLDDQEEEMIETQRQYKDKCKELDLKKRAMKDLDYEFNNVKVALEQRDRLLQESGLVIVATDDGEVKLEKGSVAQNGPTSSNTALLSTETIESLGKTGDGSLGTDIKSHISASKSVVHGDRVDSICGDRSVDITDGKQATNVCDTNTLPEPVDTHFSTEPNTDTANISPNHDINGKNPDKSLSHVSNDTTPVQSISGQTEVAEKSSIRSKSESSCIDDGKQDSEAEDEFFDAPSTPLNLSPKSQASAGKPSGGFEFIEDHFSIDNTNANDVERQTLSVSEKESSSVKETMPSEKDRKESEISETKGAVKMEEDKNQSRSETDMPDGDTDKAESLQDTRIQSSADKPETVMAVSSEVITDVMASHPPSVEESKTSSVERDESSTSVEASQPFTSVEESKPTSGEKVETSSSVEASQPSTSMEESEPTSVEASQPSPPMEELKPTSDEASQPYTSMEESKPSTFVEASQPSTSVEESKPASQPTSVEKSIPATSVEISDVIVSAEKSISDETVKDSDKVGTVEKSENMLNEQLNEIISGEASESSSCTDSWNIAKCVVEDVLIKAVQLHLNIGMHSSAENVTKGDNIPKHESDDHSEGEKPGHKSSPDKEADHSSDLILNNNGLLIENPSELMENELKVGSDKSGDREATVFDKREDINREDTPVSQNDLTDLVRDSSKGSTIEVHSENESAVLERSDEVGVSEINVRKEFRETQPGVPSADLSCKEADVHKQTDKPEKLTEKREDAMVSKDKVSDGGDKPHVPEKVGDGMDDEEYSFDDIDMVLNDDGGIDDKSKTETEKDRDSAVADLMRGIDQESVNSEEANKKMSASSSLACSLNESTGDETSATGQSIESLDSLPSDVSTSKQECHSPTPDEEEDTHKRLGSKKNKGLFGRMKSKFKGK